jgi:uncharacterized protein YdaU (DUF1376 family)
MHYYKRNLGDYAKKAGRLTMLQHGAYTLLIDSCYDREVFPTLEQALEWTWASTEAEVEAVKFVLSRFFVLDKEGCYVQDRILQELLHYHKNADTNKRIADERETKRKENSTKRVQSVDEPPPNHKPLTTNHKPIKNTATSVATPEGVSDSVWQEFKSLRKAKKAPITQRAIDALTIEANKAGWTLEKALEECVVRGWQAFKADWVATKANPADNIRITVPASNEPDPALLKIKQDEKITRPPTPEERAIFDAYRRKA